MTNRDAIDILRKLAPPRTSKKHFDDFMQARDMAIDSLSQPEPHWIPVTEGLPKEFGSYQVTTTHGKVAIYAFVPDSISSHEYWKRCVTAWMPLPEPYKGVTT